MTKKESMPQKIRESKYNEKLEVNTSLENLIGIALSPKNKIAMQKITKDDHILFTLKGDDTIYAAEFNEFGKRKKQSTIKAFRPISKDGDYYLVAGKEETGIALVEIDVTQIVQHP